MIGRIRFTHKRLNQILSVAVIVIGIYLVATPAVPKVSYQLKDTPSVNATSGDQTTRENSIVIPSAKIDASVHEGNSIAVIDYGGVWRRPQSSSDPNKSNMVIVGHNFTYKNPTPPFYALDKLNVGERIVLNWDGKQYSYTIVSKNIVSPTDTHVEDATEKPRLTLYTCYPLYIANKRMVITAERQ